VIGGGRRSDDVWVDLVHDLLRRLRLLWGTQQHVLSFLLPLLCHRDGASESGSDQHIQVVPDLIEHAVSHSAQVRGRGGKRATHIGRCEPREVVTRSDRHAHSNGITGFKQLVLVRLQQTVGAGGRRELEKLGTSPTTNTAQEVNKQMKDVRSAGRCADGSYGWNEIGAPFSSTNRSGKPESARMLWGACARSHLAVAKRTGFDWTGQESGHTNTQWRQLRPNGIFKSHLHSAAHQNQARRRGVRLYPESRATRVWWRCTKT
jgi:hypothetical protein